MEYRSYPNFVTCRMDKSVYIFVICILYGSILINFSILFSCIKYTTDTIHFLYTMQTLKCSFAIIAVIGLSYYFASFIKYI